MKSALSAQRYENDDGADNGNNPRWRILQGAAEFRFHLGTAVDNVVERNFVYITRMDVAGGKEYVKARSRRI